MTEYLVTNVRKQLSADGSHSHIVGVCTQGLIYYTRQEVVDSINEGNIWKTQADGYQARIGVVEHCPDPRCLASPYITTNPDSSEMDNLENLNPC
jgi:Protein of unknown function (DUF3892)